MEDPQHSDSFEPFNFAADDAHNLEMALSQGLWQDSPAAEQDESEPECLATIEISWDQATDAQPASMPSSVPASAPGLELVQITPLSLASSIFRPTTQSRRPLEIPVIPWLGHFASIGKRLQRETPRVRIGPGIDRAGYDPSAPSEDFPPGANSWIEDIAQVVSRHEGRADSINWNDNGAGISAGMFQANQKRGQLPALLHQMEKADRRLFAQVFGNDFADLARNRPEEIRQVVFTNATDKAPNQLGLRLQEALELPAFQQVQLVMLREKIVHAAKIASSYGIRSKRGIALVADLVNQLGEGGGNTSCGARYYLQFALSRTSESEKIAQVVSHDLKAFGRAARDRDILLDHKLNSGPIVTPEIATTSSLLNPDQTP